MDELSLSMVGWIVLAVVVLALLLLAVRYFASVAMELTRVLLVAGVVAAVVLVLWLLLRS
ncbi:MAG: hypothetical protein IPH95_14510 [Candidatus Promineofilum sp.]|nr:hypothetical protein [Promineifilum sp.]